MEKQLAHVEGGTAGVYNKAEYLRQRRQMMQWHADYLDALKDGTASRRQPEFKASVLT